MPSDVSARPSPVPSGSWMKKALVFKAVTTPRVVTVEPASGDLAPDPWIAWIGVMTTSLSVMDTDTLGTGVSASENAGSAPATIGCVMVDVVRPSTTESSIALTKTPTAAVLPSTAVTDGPNVVPSRL